MLLKKMNLFIVLSLLLSSVALGQDDGEHHGMYWLNCIKGNGEECTRSELEDPIGFKQVLIVPIGYERREKDDFLKAFQTFVESAGKAGPNVYSDQYKDQILYMSYFQPGKKLETGKAALGGKLLPHPIRSDYGIVLDEKLVEAKVEEFKARIFPFFEPISVVAIFNTDKETTANAKPPTFINKPYGIVLITKDDVKRPYLTSHELAHGGLNFLDEYVEGGFENFNIRQVDKLSNLANWGKGFKGFATWWNHIRGFYRIKISEILSGNGSDNMDVTRFPSRVSTEGYTPNEYEYEGGMFFGRGTWHDKGNNLMNSSRVTRGDDDAFAFDHSQSQREVVKQAFENPYVAPRPNDRLRNVGPVGKVKFTLSSKTKLLLYDGDKNHRWHPTYNYTVQVGWYERDWKWCKAGGWFPYPCYEKKWQVVEKVVFPKDRIINLKKTKLYGAAKFVRFLACKMGIGRLFGADKKMLERACQYDVATLADAFVPSIEYIVPYQEVKIPVKQAFTKYYWRFKANNRTIESGFTGWSKFSRIF